MKKLLSTTLAVGIMASMSFSPVLADVPVNTLPSLNNAVNADVTVNANDMNIKINAGQGGVGTLNWDSFNVGKDASVNYEFSAHNQTALNKVSATGGLSQIYGKITSSGCFNCGYEGTGKVILINPNGVLFGDGANVNLNSFTVSTFDANFDANKNLLELNKNGDSNFGIVVLEGAQIYGDKAVNFASDKVVVYNGSKISTNVAPNYENSKGGMDSYGKVKIITSDGVNFAYYNNGAVKSLSNVAASADAMTININGEILSGNIDIRNASTNTASDLNLNGAILKATKAVTGNDGNIWLTAADKVTIADSKIETVNYSVEAANRTTGEVYIKANNKVSIASSDIDAVGNVDVVSQAFDIVIDDTKVDTAKDVNLDANNVASIQNASVVNAKNVNVNGKYRSQIVRNSIVNAQNDIKMAGDTAWISNAKLQAGNAIVADALTENYPVDGGSAGNVLLENADLTAKKITLNAKTSVLGDANLNGSQTNIFAGNNINVNLANVGVRANGLVAEAGNNLTVATDGTLSVSRLVAKNGDLTLTADKVIKGLPYTTEQKLDDDKISDRGYIEVRNGKFTSNTKNDSYEVTASGERTADGKNNMRHHIQYGNGSEKILLVTKMPYVAPPVEPPVVPPVEPQEPAVDVNDDQASMLNRLPQQPQTITAVNAYSDNRTALVDVYAAASQIEIEEEEQ